MLPPSHLKSRCLGGGRWSKVANQHPGNSFECPPPGLEPFSRVYPFPFRSQGLTVCLRSHLISILLLPLPLFILFPPSLASPVSQDSLSGG